MSGRTKSTIYLASGLCIFALVLTFYLIHNRAIYVNICNGTRELIANIRLTYRGGEIGIPQLESGESAGGYVYATTETHLSLSYHAVRGNVRQEEIDTYMEPRYRGRIDIVITDQAIITRSRVRPSLLP